MYTTNDHTFVVCAYKENPFLENTIQSLRNQSALGRILISTSTPNDHIRGIASRYDIPLVINPNPHLAGDDWNYGYNQADTPLVTLAHQDDWYDPSFLAKTLEAINRYPGEEVSIAFTDYYEIREGRRVERNALLFVKRAMNTPLKSRAFNGSVLLKKRILAFGDSICCPAVTFVKEHLGESIFDTKYVNSCDYKTLVDLACARGRFVYIPKRLVGHRIYAESATTLNLADNIRKKEDAEILEALWPRPIAHAINSIYALSEKSNELQEG